ncbi:hypothetical protein ABZS76_32850 [Streptomyces sp. NPDC005562]|uniref:hypothetical protein n=1 Tax=Streptomyces sp. NPDC005562 TaxID=3154890 RepID=UPI0033B7F63B
MLGTASTVGQEYLGRIVTVRATGEYARGRLAFRAPSENAGKIEIGLQDGSTRLVTPEEIERATDYPLQLRSIPVYPDAADGSSRETGVCEREGCGITSDVIQFRQRVKGRSVKSQSLLTWCTHCYAGQGRAY